MKRPIGIVFNNKYNNYNTGFILKDKSLSDKILPPEYIGGTLYFYVQTLERLFNIKVK